MPYQPVKFTPDRYLHRRQPSCSMRTSVACRPARCAATPSTPAIAPARAAVRRGRALRDRAAMAGNGQLIAANATGCLGVFSTPYPESSWQVPWIHSLFGNAPAVATGIAAAMKVKGRNDVRVVAQGGDGGTTDIGFGCLSGMFERNDDVLYICYDNEAYMNTGVQRSSATARSAPRPRCRSVPSRATCSGRARTCPRSRWRTVFPTSPRLRWPTCATWNTRCAVRWFIRGARYIQLFVPCPLGWGTASYDTIRMARLAKESGMFPCSRPSMAKSPVC